MSNYLPEGLLSQTTENIQALKNITSLQEAMNSKKILEAGRSSATANII